ncbi:hypothetical protein [Streptosporangium sp. KLBMP 9127]|nr:hypothetical protein [Streptosporangium sp. KLBMP 9127]
MLINNDGNPPPGAPMSRAAFLRTAAGTVLGAGALFQSSAAAHAASGGEPP